MSQHKIATLDGLRGYAALLVLWAHFPLLGGSISLLSKTLATFTYAGYIGVDVFFALSGFLITRILLKEKEAGSLSFHRFYLKRHSASSPFITSPSWSLELSLAGNIWDG